MRVPAFLGVTTIATVTLAPLARLSSAQLMVPPTLWMGEADPFGLSKFFGCVDVPKRQSQSVVTFDLLRRKNPHLHLWEPGDDFPLVCVNCCFDCGKTGLTAVDGMKRFVAFLRFCDDDIHFFLDEQPAGRFD